MRILGIDYGDRKIGVAVSDPMGMIAQGVETIRWEGDYETPIKRIKEIVDHYKAEKCIVGFPKNMNGTVGERGEKTLEFIRLLKEQIHIDIISWDERLTTKAANRVMHEMGIKTSKKKAIEDQIAAVYILQNYLDSI
ncbi:MAG: Holliday junction resolvase RuvX [Bacillota bacterium]|nr:Holliday junction resolvase RuvX [Bacillota bacterium]